MWERTREAVAEILDRSRLLLLANLLVLLLISRRLETLPWQPPAQEVHENVTEGLEIVSTRLLASQMGVDTHVTSGTRKRFTFPVGNVLLRLGVTVLFGHTKIDNVDNVGALRSWTANEEVVGLDVPVDQVLLVDCLDSRQLERVSIDSYDASVETYHLLCYHDDCLDRKLPVAVVEQVLETGTEQINHQDVMEAFLAEVINIRDPGCEMLVDVQCVG